MSIYNTLVEMTKQKDLHPHAMRVIKWNEVAEKAKKTGKTSLENQWKYIEEEFDETLKALREGDFVEVVDGACDLFVVTSYACFLKAHARTGAIWNSLLENTFKYDPDISFSPLALEKAIFDDRDEFDTMEQVIALLYRLDINLGYNLSEVLSSNDSKYPTLKELRAARGKKSDGMSDEELIESECQAIEASNNGRYKGVYAKTVDDKVVFFSDAGKILKPVTFRKPKIMV